MGSNFGLPVGKEGGMVEEETEEGKMEMEMEPERETGVWALPPLARKVAQLSEPAGQEEGGTQREEEAEGWPAWALLQAPLVLANRHWWSERRSGSDH